MARGSSKPAPVIPAPPAPPPRIYEAVPVGGATGQIQCGNPILFNAAVARRLAGLDIVVCGGKTAANCQLAKQIEEAAVGPTAIHQLPHYRAGPYALPHWQPNPRPPAGHSFYETGGVKATPPKPPKPLSKAMKYFTQQLLDQASSPDEAVVEEANTEWNRAIVEYKKYLEKLRPYFTPSLRTFLDEYCMHDAEIVSRGKKAGGQSYFIIAHFEPPSTEGVSLTFTLAGPTKEIGSQRSPSYWAYEEVEKVRVKDRDAFRISILLADGSELQVPFSDMEILRFQVAPSGASPAIRSSIHGRPAGGLSAGTAPPPRKIPRN